MPFLRSLAPPLLLLLGLVSSRSAAASMRIGCELGRACPEATESAQATDAVRRVRVWTQRGRRALDGLAPKEVQDLREALAECRLLRREEPQRRTEIDLALLDLASLAWIGVERRTPQSEKSLREISRLGIAALERQLDQNPTRLASWLARDMATEDSSFERRMAALSLLRKRYVPSSRGALLALGRSAGREVATAARAALVGWDEPMVHQFFLDIVAEGAGGAVQSLQHLEQVRSELGPSAIDRLRDITGRFYLSSDWRDAARARPLVRSLPVRQAVPILIEALLTWERRAADKAGSKRIFHEIVAELRRVSGRSIGADPASWQRWWKAVQAGSVALPDEIEEAGGFMSTASFFGLQLLTDRVLFIVDRSGSMETRFGTTGRERYDQAIDELMGFLEQAGSETRFNVALFHDKGQRWRTGLQSNTESTATAIERWLSKQTPRGGTQLRAGIRAGLGLDRNNRIDLDRVQADTVVLLCDGATAEGPRWVEPWLRRENEKAQLVFHCVQIGNGGDGTLQALARGSGGQFVRRAD